VGGTGHPGDGLGIPRGGATRQVFGHLQARVHLWPQAAARPRGAARDARCPGGPRRWPHGSGHGESAGGRRRPRGRPRQWPPSTPWTVAERGGRCSRTAR
jgi:hypothetical protein